MYLPKASGGDFETSPSGTHLAQCIRIIDLGEQETAYNGQKKIAHKVMLTWQYADEFMKDGRPFTISKRYTWSMHPKAGLRKDLESWRGKKFEDADFGPGGFDVKKLLGVACLLTVTHDQGETDTYANVSTISGVPKGMPKPTPVGDGVYLWLENSEFKQDVFESLSDKLKETIRKSPQYAAVLEARAPRALPKESDRSGVRQAGGMSQAAMENGHADNFDDEIPF